MFRKPYDEHEHYYIDHGRETADVYQHQINKKGIKELVKTGETNVYEKIQEAVEDCKIENIIARVVNGDTSMLRANAQFIDTTAIPNNLIEVRQQIQAMENFWAELPREVKEKYNFSPDEFIAKSNTKEWLEDCGLIDKPKGEIKETIEKVAETMKTESEVTA